MILVVKFNEFSAGIGKLPAMQCKLAIVLLLKKNWSAKNPTLPQVFAAPASNFTETLTTEIKLKFQVSTLKTLGGIVFLTELHFSFPRCCQFNSHSRQKWDIDMKFIIGGRIDTIFMCLKLWDDKLFTFKFIGGCTLIIWKGCQIIIAGILIALITLFLKERIKKQKSVWRSKEYEKVMK